MKFALFYVLLILNKNISNNSKKVLIISLKYNILSLRIEKEVY